MRKSLSSPLDITMQTNISGVGTGGGVNDFRIADTAINPSVLGHDITI